MNFLRLGIFGLCLLGAVQSLAASFTGSTAESPDTDGAYLVKWTPASNESGPYTLKENGADIYTGSATQYSITGQSTGTYSYEVWGNQLVGGWPEPHSTYKKLGSYSVTVSVSPGVPAAPSVSTTSTTNVVQISWVKPSGASPSYYELRRNKQGTTTWELVYSGSSLSVQDTVPSQATWNFVVRACTDSTCAADSAPTSIYVNLTPGTPSVPSASSPVSAHYFTVSWIKPSGPAPTVYNLRRKFGSTGTYSVIDSRLALSFEDRNRSEGDWYYSVRACNGSYCSNYSGDRKVTVDFTGSASGIIGPVIASYGYTLSFNATYDTYKLQEQPPGGSWSTVSAGLAGAITFSGPSGGNNADGIYNYRLQEYVRNDEGDLVFTTPWSTTKPVVLAAPRVISTSAATSVDGNYSISWVGVSGASKYQYRENSGSWMDTTATSVTFTNKLPGTYTYQVRVCVGSSCNDASATKSVVVNLTPATPAAPMAPSASNQHHYAVVWNKPSGAAPTVYHLRRKLGAAGTWETVQTSSELSFAEANRTEGDWYYDVKACNGSYCSEESSAAKVTVDFGSVNGVISGPVQSLREQGFTLAFNVEWDGYELWHKVPGGDFELVKTEIKAGTISYAGPKGAGASEGTYEYRYRQTIHGSDGSILKASTWSPIKSVLVYETPSIVSGVSVSAISAAGNYNVSWHAPSQGGQYNRFEIEEQLLGDPSLTNSVVVSSSTLLLSRSAQNDGDWRYRVRACGIVDCGVWSTSASANVLKIPLAPSWQMVDASPQQGSVSFQWPGAPAGYTIDDFQIQHINAGVPGAWQALGALRSYSVSNLLEAEHSFFLRACNATGCSESSVPHQITVIYPAPEVPVVDQLSSDSQGNIGVAWKVSSTNNLDYFEIHTNGESWQVPASLRQFVVPGLPEGSHSIVLSACNSTAIPAKCVSALPREVDVGSAAPDYAQTSVSLSDVVPDANIIPAATALHQAVGAASGEGGAGGGAAMYTIPIFTPPGRNQMAPNLAVQYSSRAGNGVFGMGWSLSGASSIQRCAQTLAQDGQSVAVLYNAESDKLCLNGQRLVLISGSYGASGAVYRTEFDEFLKVTQSGGINSSTASFTVELKNGRVQYYGLTTDSRHIPAGLSHVHSWAISREVDRTENANSINYQYAEFSDGEYHLENVYYTGVGSANGTRRVHFDLEERSDLASYYHAGGLTRVTRRVAGISVEVQGNKVREYKFTYVPSGYSDRSLLDEVVECGMDFTCFPVTKLTWDSGQEVRVLDDFGYVDFQGGANYTEGSGVVVPLYTDTRKMDRILPRGDFNGDGVRDWPGHYISAEGSYVGSYGGGDDSCYREPFSFTTVCIEIDIDQDGKTDAWRKNGNYFQFALSKNGQGTYNWQATVIPLLNNDRLVNVGDYNGDTWPDLFIRKDSGATGPDYLYLYLHTGDKSNPYIDNGVQIVDYAWIESLGALQYSVQFMGDMDGNGLPDLMVSDNRLRVPGNAYAASPQPVPLHILYAEVESNGVVFNSVSAETELRGFGNWNDDYYFYYFMDINGDGLKDWVNWRGKSNKIYYRLNKGNRESTDWIDAGLADVFEKRQYYYFTGGPDGAWDYVEPPKYASAFHQMDLGGDGKAEILFPADRKITGCKKIYDNGVLKDFCGDELYGTYDSNGSGAIQIANVPSAEVDDSIYRFNALQFIEQQDGTFKATVIETELEAPAYELAVIDAYGNGLQDIVFKYGCRSVQNDCSFQNKTGRLATKSEAVYQYRSRGSASGDERYAAPDMLVAVENGLGVRDEWYYRPLSSRDDRYHSAAKPFYERGSYLDRLPASVQDDHFEFTSSMYVVAEHRQSNGIGGMNSTHFRYKGAVYNNKGRGFQGFHTVIEEDLAANVEVQTDFHQVFPLTGKSHKQRTWVLGDRSLDSEQVDAFQESGFKWQFWPAGGHAVPTIVDALGADWGVSAHTPYFVGTKETLATRRAVSLADGTRRTLFTQTESFRFDEWGNVLLATNRYEEANAAHLVSRTTETQFAAADQANWWINKPSKQTITKNPILSRTGIPIEPNTDVAQTVVVDYLLWDEYARKPKQVKTTPSTGKWAQVDTRYSAYGIPEKITTLAEGELQPRIMETIAFSSDNYFAQTVENGFGHTVTTITNPAFGQPDTVTDANGLVTSYQYDAFGRQISVVAPSANGQQLAPIGYFSLQWCDTSSCFGVPNAIFTTTQAQAGSPTEVTYHDSLGRVIQAEVEAFSGLESLVSKVSYNALGQVTFESRPNFNTPSSFGTHYLAYDVLGRVTHRQVDQTDGQVLDTHYTHEQGDQGFTTNINASGLSMSRTYNGLNQLVQTVDAKDGVTAYAYDGAGNPIVLQDANGNRITAAHNALGQKLWVNDPNMWQKSFTYTGFGELDTETDANGNVTDLNYDKLGRVTQRWVNGTQEAGWTFDTAAHGIGLPAGEQRLDASYSRSYQYDALSRPDAVTTVIDGQSFAVRSHYDANYGRVKGLQYPNGLTLAYGYTDSGYPQTVSNAASGYVYRQIEDQDASGQWRQAQMAEGLLTVQRNFDIATGQLRALRLDDPFGLVHRQSYDFYDVFGNLTDQSTEIPSSAVSQNSEHFVYDELHRLTDSSRTNGAAIHYDYDAVGNLLEKSDFAGSYHYLGAKPNAVSGVDLIGGGSVSYGYDGNGNRTHENGVQTIHYNAFNKPTQISRNGASVSFSYGADQMRYKQVKGGKTTLYIDKLFEKTTSSSGTDYRLFIEDIAVLTTQVDASNNTTHKIAFTHRDRLGSTVAISDHLGVLKETQSYDPFGKPRAGDLTDLLNAIVDSEWTTRGFTDHEHLDEVKLIHMNGRGYDYELGRFLSVDPVIQAPGNSQSLNPYSYVMNNPLAGTDPSGYCSTGTRISGRSAGNCRTAMGRTNPSKKDKLIGVTKDTATGQITGGTAITSGGQKYDFTLKAAPSKGESGGGAGGAADIEAPSSRGSGAGVVPSTSSTSQTSAAIGAVPAATTSAGDGLATAGRGILGRLGQLLFGTPLGAGVAAAIFSTKMGNGELSEEDRILDEAFRSGLVQAETQVKNLRRKNEVAVIGEGQQDRVIPYATAVNGISFSIPQRYHYESGYMKGFSDSFKESISVMFNRGWINGVMDAGFEIHDIGAHPLRGGAPTSPWYLAELQEVAIRQYPTVRVSFK